MIKKVCVIGIGYIGFSTACLLANNGYSVLGVDVNDDIIRKINLKTPHFVEKDLKGVFINALNSGKLKVSKRLEKSDIFIISVPTPLNKRNRVELSNVINATNEVSKYIEKGNLIILESTSPPGTTEHIVGKIILKKTGLKAGDDYSLSYCPERVLPGNILYELVNNKRIVGGINRRSAFEAKEVYNSFVNSEIYLTDLKTAELVKLVENTYRDVNIAFSNEISLLCNDYNANVWDVIKFANMHPRVNVLSPGPGVGGHCIPIDSWAILQNIGRKGTLIEKSRYINDNMPILISKKIMELIKDIKSPKITLFGASYKENVDDTRGSPTAIICNKLLEKKFNIIVHDPMVKKFKYDLSNLEDSLKNSDLLVLLVGHNIFKKANFNFISNLMRTKNIFDTRNFFKRKKVEKKGFNYYTI